MEGLAGSSRGESNDRKGAEARDAFAHEAVLHMDALYRVARRLSRSRDDAHDLVSATLVRALDNLERFTPGTNTAAWLQTILRNLFIDQRRRALRQPSVAAAAPAGVEELVGEADPEGRFYDSFVDAGVLRALESLPAEYRHTVVLSDLESKHQAEVAAILGVPEGTVKSRLFRGRRMLRERLRGYALEMGYLSGAA